MKNGSTPIIKHFVARIEIETGKPRVDFLEKIVLALVREMELTVVKKLSHSFQPSGETIAYILSQSHLVIHSWPKDGFLHLDLVVCVERSLADFKKALNKGVSGLKVASIKVQEVK